MAKRVDLFDSTYSHFTKQVLETIRETFGQYIGQNSWTTIEEYDPSSRGLIFDLSITTQLPLTAIA